MASTEDLDLLFGDGGVGRVADRRRWRTEVVLKLAEPAVRIYHDGRRQTVAAEAVAGVVDTTAAGDSFAAAYLAARLAGAEPAASGALRPSPGRRRGVPPRRHHPAHGNAARVQHPGPAGEQS